MSRAGAQPPCPPILVILGIILLGDTVTCLFSTCAAMNLGAIALFENMAMTEHYGFAVLVGNVVAYSLVAASWAWEAVVKRASSEPLHGLSADTINRSIWLY